MNAVCGEPQRSLGDAAEVPDAAVPRVEVQQVGGTVSRQAVQVICARVSRSGRVVQVGHAAVRGAVVGRSEAGGRVAEDRHVDRRHEEQERKAVKSAG